MSTNSNTKLDTLINEIDALEQLEYGWYSTAGVAGLPPKSAAIKGARQLITICTELGHDLPLPHIFPCIDGAVAIEWTIGDIEASIQLGEHTDKAEAATLNLKTDDHQYQNNVNITKEFLTDWLKSIASPTGSY